MGSKSDTEAVQPTLDVLKELGIDYEVNVISAHRAPEKARQSAQEARSRGIEIIIAATGGAAHLPGVLASWTILPVIGVPLASSELKGIDALYSIVQMPAGIPVATVAVGTAGDVIYHHEWPRSNGVPPIPHVSVFCYHFMGVYSRPLSNILEHL